MKFYFQLDKVRLFLIENRNRFDYPLKEKTKDDQALTIIQWLTQAKLSIVSSKTLSLKDSITEPNILNRLRSEDVSLDSLQKYVKEDCLQSVPIFEKLFVKFKKF